MCICNVEACLLIVPVEMDTEQQMSILSDIQEYSPVTVYISICLQSIAFVSMYCRQQRRDYVVP